MTRIKVLYDHNNFIADGRVWLVTVDYTIDNIDFDIKFYVAARNPDQAKAIANEDYPTANSITVDSNPVTPAQYEQREDWIKPPSLEAS